MNTLAPFEFGQNTLPPNNVVGSFLVSKNTGFGHAMLFGLIGGLFLTVLLKFITCFGMPSKPDNTQKVVINHSISRSWVHVERKK